MPPIERLTRAALMNGGRKDIMNTGIVMLACLNTQALIEAIGVTGCELLACRNAEQCEILERRRTDIAQTG